MRCIFVFAALLIFLHCARTHKHNEQQKTRKSDYATLALRGFSNGDAATPLTSAMSIGEAENLNVRVDFEHGDVALFAYGCAADNKANKRVANDAQASTLPIVFTEDSMLSPARPIDYTVRVQRNCSVQDGAAHALFGARSTSSPLWRIWTFASYARHEIRLGRKHPKNVARALEAPSAVCSGKSVERLCHVENVRLGHHNNRSELFTLDFHANDERVYLPHEAYVHYTSDTKHCTPHSHIRRVEDWPALQFYIGDTLLLKLNARHFVPHDFEQTFAVHGSRCEFVAMLIRTAGVLVPWSDSRHVQVGNVVFQEYTLDRDYLRSTIRVHAMHVADHFSFWELLAVLFIFTLYVAYKIDNATRLASYILGVLPVCQVCKKPMYTVCTQHANWDIDKQQRWQRFVVAFNYVAKFALFAIAWYAIIAASKLGVGYNEDEIVVWTYVVLGIATLQFVATEVHRSYVSSSRKRIDSVRAFGEQDWQFIYAEGLESACVVSLFALTSVVRTDDLSSQLSIVVAILAVYDGMRRFIALCIMYIVRMACMRINSTQSAVFMFWMVRALVVTLGVNVVFTVYIMSTHVFAVALTSLVWSAIFVLFAGYLALSVNMSHLRRSMEEHLVAKRSA